MGFAELIFSSLQIDISALTFKSRRHVTLKSCQVLSWVAEPYGLNTEKFFCLQGCQGVTPLLSCGQNGFMILKFKWLVEFFKVSLSRETQEKGCLMGTQEL